MNSHPNLEEPENNQVNIPFHPFKDKETVRSLQTLLKNENRSFIRFIAMIDNKANIMISLNSLILSGLVLFSKFFAPLPLIETLALIFLIVTCISSLSLSALAARPVHKMAVDTSGNPADHVFSKIIVRQISQDSFLRDFDTLIRDQGLIYKNMALEFYNLSKILQIKNKRLRWSYNTFLTGVVVTAVVILLYSIFLPATV